MDVGVPPALKLIGCISLWEYQVSSCFFDLSAEYLDVWTSNPCFQELIHVPQTIIGRMLANKNVERRIFGFVSAINAIMPCAQYAPLVLAPMISIPLPPSLTLITLIPLPLRRPPSPSFHLHNTSAAIPTMFAERSLSTEARTTKYFHFSVTSCHFQQRERLEFVVLDSTIQAKRVSTEELPRGEI